MYNGFDLKGQSDIMDPPFSHARNNLTSREFLGFKLNNSTILLYLITSLANEVMFSVAFVCVYVCKQHYSRSYKWIAMKFHGGVLGSTIHKWLNLGGDMGLCR